MRARRIIRRAPSSSALFSASVLLSLAACGGRVALSDDASADPPHVDGSGSSGGGTTDDVPPGTSSTTDAQARTDSRPSVDGATHPDGDASSSSDAEVDALPPIDASAPDADLTGCTPGTTAAYVVSTDNQLYRFDPETMTKTLLGTAACPTAASAYSMTASRAGTLYALYTDWQIYAIDPQTLACTLTPFADSQLGFPGNVGIAVTRVGGEERFFVAGAQSSGDHVLASGDLTTFTLSKVGTISPRPNGYPMDMQSDSFNRLWAIPTSGDLVLIDPATAAVRGRDTILGFDPHGTWALLMWGRDAFAFGATSNSSGSTSNVVRYDPSTKAVTATSTLGIRVIAAAATPCVP